MIRTAFPDSLSARIHEADIADVAVKALTEEGHDKRTYDLTGPEALSPRSMVKQISAVIDKYIDLVEINSLLVPLILIALAMVLSIWPNMQFLIKFFSVWPFYAMIFGILFPIVLWLVGKVGGSLKLRKNYH
ncbi:SDR family oxidoreductase [Paenibacillus sp. 8b26]|uniref:SDR family oxidoreductase n=1 Tax=Paenibacillus sp. 8b26 TaxID=3424133 RepID=UPI003D64F1A0